MATFKIIKQKSFTAQNESHVHYTVAYMGRVFGVSSLRFDSIDNPFTVKDSVLTINCDIAVVKNAGTDPLTGKSYCYLDIVPKISTFSLADF